MLKYSEIVGVLRVYARLGAFGVIDRIAGALTPEAVEQALYDALRGMNAMIRQATRVKVKINEREEVLDIIDWSEKLDDPRLQLAEEGSVIDVIKGPAELKGKRVKFVRAPTMLPSEDSVSSFLRAVKERGFEGLSLAREVALKALTRG